MAANTIVHSTRDRRPPVKRPDPSARGFSPEIHDLVVALGFESGVEILSLRDPLGARALCTPFGSSPIRHESTSVLIDPLNENVCGPRVVSGTVPVATGSTWCIERELVGPRFPSLGRGVALLGGYFEETGADEDAGFGVWEVVRSTPTREELVGRSGNDAASVADRPVGPRSTCRAQKDRWPAHAAALPVPPRSVTPPASPRAPAVGQEADQAGATMPTTGLLRGFPPMEPKYEASPKLNTPPSAATSQ